LEVSLIRILFALLLVLAWFPSHWGADASPLLAPTTYHVATNGADSNPGTDSKPFRTIQKAVNAAKPGDSILVHAGVYREVVTIRTSGTSAARIRLTSAGDGQVTLQPTLAKVSCGASAPTRNRAIQFIDGTDNWTVSNLTIVGGVVVSGGSIGKLKGSLFTNRSLPGRGSYDPTAAATLLPKLGVNPADNIQLLNNKISGRGLLAIAARWGQLKGNEIHHIECGTGAAVWINRFSDFWQVTDNYVHDVAASVEHPMEEGIRQGSGSSYNQVVNNLVEGLAGRGRGVTTDVNASWNLIQGNTVRRADQGFNEQTGGWGNQWIGNLAESNRQYGLNIDGKDGGLMSPDDGMPALTVVKCFVARNNGDDALHVGAVKQAKFSSNAFPSVWLSKGVKNYWSKVGNTWDGSSAMPSERPAQKLC
jgi:hypothetical protein